MSAAIGMVKIVVNLQVNNFNFQSTDMSQKYAKNYSSEDAKRIGDTLGIKWDKFNVEQFRMGLYVELEHGTIDPHTNVSNDDDVITGKIALAHLNEFSDYYTRLEKMEEEAENFWEGKNQS